MTQTIRLNRKDFIARLASVKDDNIAIADVVINRNKLLEALKLQAEDILTLTYGKVSWEDKFKSQGNTSREGYRRTETVKEIIKQERPDLLEVKEK